MLGQRLVATRLGVAVRTYAATARSLHCGWLLSLYAHFRGYYQATSMPGSRYASNSVLLAAVNPCGSVRVTWSHIMGNSGSWTKQENYSFGERVLFCLSLDFTLPDIGYHYCSIRRPNQCSRGTQLPCPYLMCHRKYVQCYRPQVP